MFFSLDGIDGTGKSTQVKLLADALRGRGFTVTTCVDPGGTELGGVGPVAEGLWAWVVGMGLLIGCAVWVGAKSS